MRPAASSRSRLPSTLLFVLLVGVPLVLGCAGVDDRSGGKNPIGWPAKGIGSVGFAGADSGWPVLREGGRLLAAAADLLEFPALAVEGIATLDGPKLARTPSKLIVGTGGSLTAAINLPFSLFATGNIDLGRDAAAVNDALTHMEAAEPTSWRTGAADRREFIVPPGTRVRASGKNLVWTVPGQGEIVQAGEESLLFRLAQAFAPEFIAQERSWGMVVGRLERWDARRGNERAQTIIHEFVHQHMQMRRWLGGWTVLYWPAYGISFLRHGWYGHWAETDGPHAAGAVDNALRGWRCD